jgi:Protein of unknown function (DUF1461)
MSGLTLARGGALSPVAGGVISLATVVAIAALSLAALFNPLWIHAAQDRANVAAITGWTRGDVARVTDSIVADVVIGPPAFAVTSPTGGAVLDPGEQGHMRDVFAVLRGFAVVVLLLGASGGWILWRRRSDAAAWTAISRGAGGLAVVGAVLAVVVVVAFDAAFRVFHLVFFPGGNFSFDPATERLTQLFPDQFWIESATTVVLLGVLLSAIGWVVAHRRAARLNAAIGR